ncbi:thioredoxin-disulfide reductase [Lentisphaerota bacterium WC36G]|nr:thioredoxin-disulfide reductase [Lentisphaerae bacterium WC36]
MEKVVIIGSGSAGLTAAIYCARANLNPKVYTGILTGGLLTQTSDVENFPGFPESVNGFELMYKFQEQAQRFGAEIINDSITDAQLNPGDIHKLKTASGQEIETESIIIATGATPRYLGLDAEKRLLNHGVSACATCDGAFYRDVPVVVIGGGDTAMEEATFLTKFASKVTVIHRRDELRASKIMAERAMNNPKIDFKWSCVVEDIIGEEEVGGVIIRDLKTNTTSTINCKGYFAALGHVPATEMFNGQIAMDANGFIDLDAHSSCTSCLGVFGAGDCADHVYRQAITAAGMGCRAAIDAERYLQIRET